MAKKPPTPSNPNPNKPKPPTPEDPNPNRKPPTPENPTGDPNADDTNT
jgi:hypothetical protein